MKKTFFLLVFVVFSIGIISAQTNKNKFVEVLYFKANLACCKAKACNMLESDVQNIVVKNFPNGNVIFTEIKLVEDSNKVIIDKYKAQSQTLIIVQHKKKKENSFNASELVSKYNQDKNKEEFEKALVLKINENLKF